MDDQFSRTPLSTDDFYGDLNKKYNIPTSPTNTAMPSTGVAPPTTVQQPRSAIPTPPIDKPTTSEPLSKTPLKPTGQEDSWLTGAGKAVLMTADRLAQSVAGHIRQIEEASVASAVRLPFEAASIVSKPIDWAEDKILSTISGEEVKNPYGREEFISDLGKKATSYLPDVLHKAPIESAEKALGMDQTLGQSMGDVYSALPKRDAPVVDKGTSPVKYHVLNTLPSVIMAVGAALASKNPEVGLNLFLLQAAGQSYDEQRRAGTDVARASAAGLISGYAEKYTEKLPFEALMKLGKGFIERTLKSTALDIPGELLATTIQNGLVEKATTNPNMTWNEYTEALKDTLIQTAIAGPMQASLIHPLVRHVENEQIKDLEKTTQAPGFKYASGMSVLNMHQSVENLLEGRPDDEKLIALKGTLTSALADKNIDVASTRLYHEARIIEQKLAAGENVKPEEIAKVTEGLAAKGMTFNDLELSREFSTGMSILGTLDAKRDSGKPLSEEETKLYTETDTRIRETLKMMNDDGRAALPYGSDASGIVYAKPGATKLAAETATPAPVAQTPVSAARGALFKEGEDTNVSAKDILLGSEDELQTPEGQGKLDNIIAQGGQPAATVEEEQPPGTTIDLTNTVTAPLNETILESSLANIPTNGTPATLKVGKADVTVTKNDNANIHIDRVEIPPAERGQGGLEQSLQELMNYADKNGITLSTNVMPDKLADGSYDQGMADSLIRVYQRNGFAPIVLDGETYRNDLERKPQGGVAAPVKPVLSATTAQGVLAMPNGISALDGDANLEQRRKIIMEVTGTTERPGRMQSGMKQVRAALAQAAGINTIGQDNAVVDAAINTWMQSLVASEGAKNGEQGQGTGTIGQGSDGKRFNTLSPLQQGHQREVEGLRGRCLAQSRTKPGDFSKKLRELLEQNTGIFLDLEGYNHPAYEILNNFLTPFGLELIPYKVADNSLYAMIDPESQKVFMDMSLEGEVPLQRTLAHELSHWIKSTTEPGKTVNQVEQGKVDKTSQAFIEYSAGTNSVWKDGRQQTEAYILEEFIADVQAGRDMVFGVKLSDGIKAGMSVSLVAGIPGETRTSIMSTAVAQAPVQTETTDHLGTEEGKPTEPTRAGPGQSVIEKDLAESTPESREALVNDIFGPKKQTEVGGARGPVRVDGDIKKGIATVKDIAKETSAALEATGVKVDPVKLQAILDKFNNLPDIKTSAREVVPTEPGFDANFYAEIKPLFDSVFEDFKAGGQGLKEFVTAIYTMVPNPEKTQSYLLHYMNDAATATTQAPAAPAEETPADLPSAETVTETPVPEASPAPSLADQYKAARNAFAVMHAEGLTPSRRAAYLKGYGMETSAVVRHLEGRPTDKEVENETKTLNKNQVGKTVTTPDGVGQITGTPSFGKVPVKVNGIIKSYPASVLTSPVATAEQAVESLRTKAEKIAKDYLDIKDEIASPAETPAPVDEVKEPIVTEPTAETEEAAPAEPPATPGTEEVAQPEGKDTEVGGDRDTETAPPEDAIAEPPKTTVGGARAPRGKKLQNVGEEMEGRRSSKDHTERVAALKISLDEAAVGEPKQIVNAILKLTVKSNIFKVDLAAEGRTPGLGRWLASLRSSLTGFLEYAGGYAGGSRNKYGISYKDALIDAVSTDEGQAVVRGQAAKYIAVLEELYEATQDSINIDQAVKAIYGKILLPEYTAFDFETKGGDPNFMTDLGKDLAGYNDYGKLTSFSKLITQMSETANTIMEGENDPTRNLPIVRHNLGIFDIKTSEEWRHGQNKVGADLINDFSFRGVEYGEWTEGPHRQQSTNLFYDSMCDLASVIGAPNAAIAANGEKKALGIAFGSRGHGGRSLAFYQTGHVVINLTKFNGDGSVAHEMSHFFHLAKQLTHNGADVWKDLIETLKVEYTLDNLERRVEEILRGMDHNIRSMSPTQNRLEDAKKFLQESLDAEFKHDTNFYKASLGLDGDVADKYWSQGTEMMARAFEGFVADKIQGGNGYLVDVAFVAPGATEAMFNRDHAAYPTAAEREKFNLIFTRLFDNMIWAEDGTISMKPDFVMLSAQQKADAEAAAKLLLDKLDAWYKLIYQSQQSEDGLYWYAYKATARGATMQQDGFTGFDDSYRLTNESDIEKQKEGEGPKEYLGTGAIGYPVELHPDTIVKYNLVPITHVNNDKTIYLKEGENGLPGSENTEPMESESASDGQTVGGIRNTGRDSEQPGGEGDRGNALVDAEGNPVAPGGGSSIGEVDVAGGAGHIDAGSGALSSDLIDFVIHSTDLAADGTSAAAFNGNLAAIRTLKKIESENRRATAAEQLILFQFRGWGNLAEALSSSPQGAWKDRAEMLRRELTDKEYWAARSVVESSCHVPFGVYDAIYRGLSKFGYTGGRFLDVSFGIGHSIGLMPPSMRKGTVMTAIEGDSISARIAQQLYQNAKVIQQSLDRTKLAEGFYDLSIAHVPFNQNRPNDRIYNPRGNQLTAEYSLTRQLAAVRPGGIAIMITSGDLLNNRDTYNREGWAQEADLIGAISVPNGLFVDQKYPKMTNIIIMRKRFENQKSNGISFTGTEPFRAFPISKDGTVSRWEDVEYVNKYFIDHPEMVLGEHVIIEQGKWNDAALGLKGDLEGINDKIDAAIQTLPTGVYQKEKTYDQSDIGDRLPDASVVKDRNIFVDGKAVMINIGGVNQPWVPKIVKKNIPKGMTQDAYVAKLHEMMRKYVGLRGTLRDLLKAQCKNDGSMKQLRKDLNKKYEAFFKAHGRMNDFANYQFIMNDADGGQMAALEEYQYPEPTIVINEDGTESTTQDPGVFKKLADIFTMNTIKIAVPPTSAATPDEALTHSLAWRGRVDMPYMESLLGMSSKDIYEQLKGKIFDDPKQGLVTADEYLSGLVRDKLRYAEEAAAVDDRYKENVLRLKAIIPVDLEPHQIPAHLGAPWISAELVSEFAQYMMNNSSINIRYVPEVGTWTIEVTGRTQESAKDKKRMINGSVAATSTWGTTSVGFLAGKNGTGTGLLDFALNGGMPKVMGGQSSTVNPVTGEFERYYITNDKGEVTQEFLNPEETDAAYAKLEAIRERFSSWLWESKSRSAVAVRAYNDLHNQIVDRKFNGDHLLLPGKVPDEVIKLAPHQLAAAWRYITTGKVYYAHGVGVGKAQPLDAKLLTPTGWKLMGDIVVGDTVIAGNGSPTTVEAVYPQGEKEIFRVVFSDGSSTECCNEHLWLTKNYYERNKAGQAKRAIKSEWKCDKAKVRSLSEIRETLSAPHLGAKNHSIPIVGTVQFEEQATDINPYLMGCLLGDGGFRGSAITISSKDDELLESVRAALPPQCALIYQSGVDYAIRYQGKMHGFRGSHPIIQALRKDKLWGHYSHEKFIPSNYLYNSAKVRIDVLQGLMDTDGWVNKPGTSVFFCTSSSRLADDVTTIVQSLGGVVKRTEKKPKYTHKGERRDGRIAYSLCLCLPNTINPFRLRRKALLVKDKTSHAPARYIVEVIAVGKKKAQCIRVADPSHLYVTDNFIVTHNTFAMITAIMEAKRLGLRKKTILSVKKANLDQIRADFYRLYPTANVLTVDMTKESMAEDYRRMAGADYDTIIMTHEALGRMKISAETELQYQQTEADKLEKAAKVEHERTSYGRKSKPGIAERAMRSQLKILKARIEALQKEVNDGSPTFESSGVDALVIDEAHMAKNLDIKTNYQNVKGIKSQESSRADNVFLKTQYIINNFGGGLIFASGTPLSNSIGELYSLQRHFQTDHLIKTGLNGFDQWAATFGIIGQEAEQLPEGGGLTVVTRFLKFRGIPELTAKVRLFMDIVTADEVGIPVPKIANPGGIAELVDIEPSPEFLADQKELKRRAETYRHNMKGTVVNKPAGLPKSHKHTWDPVTMICSGCGAQWTGTSYNGVPDNIVRIVSDGRDASLEGRLVDPSRKDTENTKANAVVKNIVKLYNMPHNAIDLETGKEYLEHKGVQLIFSDRGVPGTHRFSVYDDIKNKLIANGIPAHEIAFIQDATNAKGNAMQKEEKKRKLLADARSGKIRILIGGTQNLGTGTNVQDLGVAVHNLDADWNAANQTQRIGRFIRRGNRIVEVYVYNYGIKKSVDSFMWSTVGQKQYIMSQVLSKNPLIRETEDIAVDDLNAKGYAAILEDDPLMTEKFKLETIVRKLRSQRGVYDQTKREHRGLLQALPPNIESLEALLAPALAGKEIIDGVTAIKIGTEFYDLSKDGGKINELSEQVFPEEEINAYFEAKKAMDTEIATKRNELSMVKNITIKERDERLDAIQKIKNDFNAAYHRVDPMNFINGSEFFGMLGTIVEESMMVKNEKTGEDVEMKVKKFVPADARVGITPAQHPKGADWLNGTETIFEIKTGAGVRQYHALSAGFNRALTAFKNDNDKTIARFQEKIAFDKAEIEKLQEAIQGTFPKAQELEEQTRRLQEVTAQLIEQQRRAEEELRNEALRLKTSVRPTTEGVTVPGEQAKWIGDYVQRAFKTNDIAGILINSDVTQSGPLDGGCLVLAKALNQLEPDGKIITIEGHLGGQEWQAEHYGLALDGGVIDGDGYARSPQQWAKRFAKLESFARPYRVTESLVPSNEIKTDAALENQLAEALNEFIDKNEAVKQTKIDTLEKAHDAAIKKGDYLAAGHYAAQGAKLMGSEFKPGGNRTNMHAVSAPVHGRIKGQARATESEMTNKTATRLVNILRKEPRPMENWGTITDILAKTDDLGFLPSDATAEATQLDVQNKLEKAPTVEELASTAWAGRAAQWWYKDDREFFGKYLGKDLFKFFGVMAATSPQSAAETENIKLGVTVWSDYLDLRKELGRDPNEKEIGQYIDTLNMAPNKKSGIERALLGLELGKSADTMKTRFYQNALFGNELGAVLDIWHGRGMAQTRFGITKGKLALQQDFSSGIVYRVLGDRMDQAAQMVGLGNTQSASQAAQWCMIKAIWKKMGDSKKPRTMSGIEALKNITNKDIAKAGNYTTGIANYFKEGHPIINTLEKIGIPLSAIRELQPAWTKLADRGIDPDAKIYASAPAEIQRQLVRLANRLEEARDTTETLKMQERAAAKRVEGLHVSVETTHGPFADLPLTKRIAMQAAIREEVFSDQKIINLGVTFGVKVTSVVEGPGVWFNPVTKKVEKNPNFTPIIAVPDGPIPAELATRIRGFAATLAYANEQKALGFIHPIKIDELFQSLGGPILHVSLGKTISYAQSDALATGLAADFPNGTVYSTPTSDGVLIAMNKKGDDYPHDFATFFTKVDKVLDNTLGSAVKSYHISEMENFPGGNYYEQTGKYDTGADSGQVERVAPEFRSAIEQGGGPGAVKSADKFLSDIRAIKDRFATQRIRKLLGGTAREKDGSTVRKGPTGEYVQAVGLHYSNGSRTVLSSSKYGTGATAKEAERVANEPRLQHRINFYINDGAGILKEAIVRGYAHKADLNYLYDADVDPLNLMNGNPNAFELAVMDNGYDGIVRRAVGVATLLGVRELPVQETEDTTVPQMEPAKWTVAQITSRELKANTEIRQGRMNGPAWIEHLQEDHPDLYKDLDAKGFIEPLKTYTERITRSQIPFIKQIQEARNGQSGVLGKSTEAGIPGKGAGKGRIKTQARGTAGPERSANYPEAAGKAGNPWIKQDDVESNKGRTLLVQFTSNLMGTGVDSSADYYNKLYSGAREGYSRLDDFWEIPQWIGQVANTIPNTDVYIVRDMEDAKKFVAESGYDHIAFSSLDVTIPLIKELAPSFPGKVSIGGYANKEAFKDVNHQWFDSIAEMADEFGHAYDQGTDYKHFAGSQVIPRLTMSQGCKYKCAFCTVPKQLDIASNEFIDQQLESFKDLDARLIYLNDKTFGQANNYQYLSTLNERMKKMNPKFEGFIIQTTASDLNKMPVEWLQKSGIKYVELGVESYNDFILKSLHKPHNEKIIDKATAKLRDLNINLVPNIIIGIPEETSETYERTLVYLEKNKDIISHANIYNLALYEGTELSDKIETKSESDSDENVGKKSFHQDETPHEQFSDKVFTMMKDRLSEPPVTAPIKTQARNINTETPEFKAWFGESKVVDGGGKPLVVYRGMTNDTQPAGEFGGKNWFAEDPSHASVYAMEDEGYEEGANVSSVYLQITNPLDVGDIEAYDPITRMPKYEKINSPDFIAEAKQQGYDGLVAMEAHASTGKPTRTFLAFSPTQIKSVNNRGTWDAKNPDIRMMARPVQEPEKSYPDIKWVKRQLHTNLYSRVNHDVLDAFIVGSEAKGTAKDDSDIDVAVIIPKVQGKSALQVSERYHSRFMKESQKPTWDGRVIDFQFFYQDDPELVGYQKIPLGTKQTELKTKARSANADSPEFKKWFGDSKVVDENGEPLVVYHGTKNSFNEFDVEKHGVVFFTPDKSSATNYAYERSEGSKGHVFSTFLKMENPEIIDYKGKGDNDIYQDAVDAQADGKDGLIALNTDDGNKIIDQYAVFSPTQIKSATDNVGTFDANNPDIRAMARPVTATSRVSATEAASQFPEVNERLESNRGTKELTIKEKAEEKFKSGWKDVTRHFPALEKSDAAIADVLRRFQDAPHWAKEETGNKIISFVKDLGEHGRKVYGMNIILRDMIKDIKAGRKAGESPEGLQFGYKNLQQVEADLKHFQDIADKHPEIKAALERRNEYMRQITDDLIRLKLLPKDTVNNPAEYFHHQVMIYTIDKQQQMQSVGTGKDVRVHTKGFQKGRNESLQDYNTEYVEAEFDVIANSLVQIRTAEVIKELEGLADVKPEMDLKAKQMNTEKFWQKIQDRKFTGVMQHDDDPLLPFKAKLAVGFQRLYRAITAENSNVYIPDEFQEVVEHLQEMAELRKEAKQEGVEFFPSTHPKMFALLNFLANSKTDAAIPAATIFKAIASRNAFIREVVGKDWKTYKDLMGKDEYADYTEFTPDSSPAFFKINSLTDQAVEQVAQGIKDVKEAIKPILAKGYNTQWVVKKGVKYTLDNFKPQTNESALETISKTALSTWKQWILVNPFRVIKYNFNNISGDMDACIAYDWRIVKDYGWQAMKDLYSASKGQASKELMQELSDKTKMGIIGSGMTQMDIGDLSGNKPVKDMVDFLDGKANGIVSLSRWYGTSKKFSTMRENILRLAAARYFEARLAKGDKIYAASDKEEIDAVRAQLGDAETAAKLARELLGDYGNISHAGQYIRQRLIPFWSWCVPADTEILTKNGWKHKEDLIIGEDVLTYNMEKRITEWQPVQDKAEYPFNGDLVTLKNSYGFKYQFTEDHRVVVIEKYNDQRKIVLAKDLKTHQHIPLVAPHKFTEDSILSVTDAALLGWLVTDGYFRTRDHSPNSFEAMLYQKKPEMVSKIRSMFADYISSESIHPDTGTICFRLKAGEMMNIRKVFSSKEDMPSIVTRLSEDACNAMYQAMLDAEGTVTLGVGGSTAFPQNDGPVLDAFQILCYMLGKAGHIREKNCKGHFGQDGKQHTIYVKKGDKLQINKWQKSLEHYDGVVWCPKTENSTWIMRQNGKVMITGNCEINAPRYVRLFRNLSNEEGKGIAGLSSAMAWKASSLGLKASLLMVLIMIWNAAMFPDEEDELQETGRQQLHAILGRREDGSIMTIRFQGALSDALGWFGMSNPLEQFRAVQSGHKGAADIAKDVSSAGALKIFQGFRPEPKLLYETISGQSFYPNPGRPTPIRDTYEHIARVFSLDKIYNRAAGKPLKGGTWENQLSRDIAGLLINESDPGEQAYYTSRKMVFDWLEKNGKERGSALPTNSSNALYYYKQALKYGDMDAAEKYLKKYQDLGGKFHGIQMSIQRAHPLSSLKLSDRAKFKESLSLEDKQTMDVALEWYKKHFREAYAEQRKAAAKQ